MRSRFEFKQGLPRKDYGDCFNDLSGIHLYVPVEVENLILGIKATVTVISFHNLRNGQG
jgi:hypothetical protein